MANEEHLRVIKDGVAVWNRWRSDNAETIPNLAGVELGVAELEGANLSKAHLDHANLTWACLDGANLSEASLIGANAYKAHLSGARLGGATLKRANLSLAGLNEADLSGADLAGAVLFGASLRGSNLAGASLRSTSFMHAGLDGADFSGARLGDTILAKVNLASVKGLEKCEHESSSVIDYETMRLSGTLPKQFLRGCGLTDVLIDFLPTLSRSSRFHSCFISYSSKDEGFAKKLYDDLQNRGVRCWYALESMKTGDKMRSAIDSGIRSNDKLLVILSENSIDSAWVEKEVETAMEEERKRRQTVLFPVRLDDAVMQTSQPWAADIRRSRQIGDFRFWQDDKKYPVAFERLLRDLSVQP